MNEFIEVDDDVKDALLFIDVEIEIGKGIIISTSLPVVEIPESWNIDTNTFHLKARIKK